MKTRRPSWTAVVMTTAVLGMLALMVVGAAWHAQGGRWFVTTTPSMGRALPVGTFLTTKPVPFADIEEGDVVSFRSPSSDAVFTHRVVGVTGSGLETRGDINGVPDSWVITDREVVGEVAWHAPVLGWVTKAVPLLVLGTGLVWVVTRRLRPARRTSWRTVGNSVVVAAVGWWLSPWVGLSRLGQTTAPEGERGVLMDVVSTGLLPIKVSEVDGTAWTDLVNGQVGRMHLTAGSESGAFDVAASLHLTWWGWLILAACCLVPMWVSLLLSQLRPEHVERASS